MNDKMPENIWLLPESKKYYDGSIQNEDRQKYIRSDLHDRRVTELLEANNRLVEENRKLKAGVQPWQTIDGAPRDGTAILGFVKSDVSDDTWQDVIYYKDFCDKFFSGTRLVNPTHWMPLPEPPK